VTHFWVVSSIKYPAGQKYTQYWLYLYVPEGHDVAHVRLSESANVPLEQLVAMMQVLLLLVRLANRGPKVDEAGQMSTHLSTVGS